MTNKLGESDLGALQTIPFRHDASLFVMTLNEFVREELQIHKDIFHAFKILSPYMNKPSYGFNVKKKSFSKIHAE